MKKPMSKRTKNTVYFLLVEIFTALHERKKYLLYLTTGGKMLNFYIQLLVCIPRLSGQRRETDTYRGPFLIPSLEGSKVQLFLPGYLQRKIGSPGDAYFSGVTYCSMLTVAHHTVDTQPV